jgi:hypothetical protein
LDQVHARSDFFHVADATHAFQKELVRHLREVDRKALNAQVLVKRHGKALAGFGIVAQAYRDGARTLQDVAGDVQQTIGPLIAWYTRSLRDRQYAHHMRRFPSRHLQQIAEVRNCSRRLDAAVAQNRQDGGRAALALRRCIDRFETVLAELEYVMVNGRIETALKGEARELLARVATDMDDAVRQVRQLVRAYRERIDPLLPDAPGAGAG